MYEEVYDFQRKEERQVGEDLSGQPLKRPEKFEYLWPLFHRNGNINADVTH